MKAGTGMDQDSVSIFVGTWNMGMRDTPTFPTPPVVSVSVPFQAMPARPETSRPGSVLPGRERLFLTHWLNPTTYMPLERRYGSMES